MYSKIRLTKKQKQIFKFIKTSIRKRGFPPTIRETMKYFDFKSPKTVQDYICQLTKKKKIKLRYLSSSKKRAARGIKINRKTKTK